MLRDSLIELLGTFTLVLVGAAASASGQGVVVGALSHGMVVIGIIYVYGHVSGAHINPAVTAGLLAGRQIKPLRAMSYWIAQFAGGILAAILLSFILSNRHDLGQTVGSLTQNAVWSAATFELILTFFLVSAVYQAAVFGKAGNFAAVAIGFTLVGCILAGGTYTGASLNPARTLGPALVAGDFSYLLPYFVGIFGGGVLAGVTHATVLKPV